eukprot:TRINITY_DN62790_c0_g1_i1.p1 TRINITY_DN62790_c0_g1~~TRINITY_DN62790_c0_g1_i1.p1  ORF type:complete len:243 (-),score=21.55 TRINITY_DN62790_c0_g1_i1:295-1023(-)
MASLCVESGGASLQPQPAEKHSATPVKLKPAWRPVVLMNRANPLHRSQRNFGAAQSADDEIVLQLHFSRQDQGSPRGGGDSSMLSDDSRSSLGGPLQELSRRNLQLPGNSCTLAKQYAVIHGVNPPLSGVDSPLRPLSRSYSGSFLDSIKPRRVHPAQPEALQVSQILPPKATHATSERMLDRSSVSDSLPGQRTADAVTSADPVHSKFQGGFAPGNWNRKLDRPGRLGTGYHLRMKALEGL